MYNRYIPNANGVYSRQSIPEPPPVERQPEEPVTVRNKPNREMPGSRQSTQKRGPTIDTGDLLLLCIVLLILLESEDDTMTLLITAAAFLLL